MYLQSWYGLFAVSGSAHMNSLLAHEVCKMLACGQHCRRQVANQSEAANPSFFDAICSQFENPNKTQKEEEQKRLAEEQNVKI